MTEPVVQVRNVSKRYQRGAIGAKSLQDEWAAWWHHVWHPERKIINRQFWALEDVSFSIMPGEVLGVIGRNGAGKSTLLKILSQITEPTEGEIILRGRIGNLLEVGAGFDPQLDGYENIFLNGTMLGMTRNEIAKKLDHIVAFADIGDFLDTPVKRYSSGMYVRLAFAVAAHLEPDILIVDEVLAVGDTQFQHKCLGKMHDVADSGRTVIFVSHNMASIRNLCTSTIYLNDGHVKALGRPDEVIAGYMATLSNGSDTGCVAVNGVTVGLVLCNDKNGVACAHAFMGEDYRFVLRVDASVVVARATPVVEIRDAEGALVSSLGSAEEGLDPFTISGAVDVTFLLPALPLFPGTYFASLYLHQWGEPKPFLVAEQILKFEVVPAMMNNAACAYEGNQGMVRLARGVALQHR
jgi:lipopolysaccharide transport system ATP-binding protein